MIERGEGLTPSEKYLKYLCEKTFLSLWSYTNVYRQPGTELCDLLVVVGDDILIFSDKYCKFPSSGDLDLDWKRWFRRAVADSAKQLWGAEKWIINFPDRIFLDSKCEKKFPIQLNITANTRFHLILVAHGGSERCRAEMKGSGSFSFNNRVQGLQCHSTPFTIGDLDTNKTFIHVLDDHTLNIVLANRDTISDFTTYLRRKGIFLRSDLNIISAGEENMLAYYLMQYNENNEHDFVIPHDAASFKTIIVAKGMWDEFQEHPQRIAQIDADKISYIWDRIIEEISHFALSGTQYQISEGGFEDSEKALRFLALESRFSRRILSAALREMKMTTPADSRRIRVTQGANGIYFIFLLLPITNQYSNGTHESYRTTRSVLLEICCRITRLLHPDASFVVGYATESGTNLESHSSDLMCFDCSQWDEEMEEQTKKDQQDFRILLSPNYIETVNQEFPEA